MTDNRSDRYDFQSWERGTLEASSGLDDRDVFEIARFASRLPGEWLVEWHEDGAGEVAVLLIVRNAEENMLVFYRDNDRAHLSILSQDTDEHISCANQFQLLFPAAEREIVTRGWICGESSRGVASAGRCRLGRSSPTQAAPW
jgi:hypothetical protein